MKEIEFSEDKLQDLQKLAEEMLFEENDPRSPTYVRELRRPPVKWFKICFCVLFPIAVFIAVFFILRRFGVSTAVCIAAPAVLFLIYIIVFAKRAAVCAVRIYQRYAPDSVRNKCRFEPSCSEYMILAIEKYGLIRGVIKGIGRLRRCNVHSGGYDLP